MLCGTNEVQRLNLDLTSDVVFASVADPYIALLTEEGQVVIVTLVGDKLVTSLTQLHKVMSEIKKGTKYQVFF